MCNDLLEVHEPTYGFEGVAGVPHAIQYFQTLKWRVQAGDSSVPQAIALVGVPGCGKSFLVKALAKELGYPCLAMRNVRDRWVGASERNLELVLWVAEPLAPCLIWIDELDQVMGQRNTGQSAAGTSERMMARIWEFMGSLLALSSGTISLLTALMVCGVQRGDEVILSPYDWSASTACVMKKPP